MANVFFELKTPDDGGDGRSFGSVEANALPRKGDRMCIRGKQVTGKKDYAGNPLECVVTDVVFVLNLNDEPWTKDSHHEADIEVWVAEEYPVMTIYCLCSDEDRKVLYEAYLERKKLGTTRNSESDYVDADGVCFNCGKARGTP